MATEREKMVAGELYFASDPELTEARIRARLLLQEYNALGPTALDRQQQVLADLFGQFGKNTQIEPPFFCDYGSQIFVGNRVFVNFNCVFLDCGRISVGDDTQIAPGVQLLTATHPIDAATRISGAEYARPIDIGARVWLGGGTVVLPGVTIGDETVVGAGSVVTRSLPAGVVAFGNPCRVVRKISD